MSARELKLKVVVQQGEDGWLVAECLNLPGCITQGQTMEEVTANMQEAITGWLEVFLEKQEESTSALELANDSGIEMSLSVCY